MKLLHAWSFLGTKGKMKCPQRQKWGSQLSYNLLMAVFFGLFHIWGSHGRLHEQNTGIGFSWLPRKVWEPLAWGLLYETMKAIIWLFWCPGPHLYQNTMQSDHLGAKCSSSKTFSQGALGRLVELHVHTHTHSCPTTASENPAEHPWWIMLLPVLLINSQSMIANASRSRGMRLCVVIHAFL